MGMVNTIHGPMDESLLEKREGKLDNENENTTWIEYWYQGQLVHRSAHVTLKTGLFGTGEIATLG